MPIVTLTEKYSTFPLNLAPMSENSAAVIVAGPSGWSVGTATLAVMLARMFELSGFRS